MAKRRKMDVDAPGALDHELAQLKRAVSAVNRLRPPGVFVVGGVQETLRKPGVFGLWRPLSRSDSSRFGYFLDR